MKMIDCAYCKKPVKVFPKRERTSKTITCSMKCSSILKKSRDKNETCANCSSKFKLKPYHKKRYKGPFCCSKKCRAEFLVHHYLGNNNPNFKYETGLQRLFAERCADIKGRCLEKSIPFDLNSEYLLSIYNNQKGLCFYTKIPLKLHTDMFSKKGQPDPDILSVDRIIPSKGYTKGNIALCCNAINKLKGNMQVEDLDYFITQLRDHYPKIELVEVDDLGTSDRGTGGFGSSGT